MLPTLAFLQVYIQTYYEAFVQSFERAAKRSLRSDKRASVGMVIALIATVAVLAIGVYILTTFEGAMPTITDETANTTKNNIFTAAWNAFGLAVVIPIVVVAGAIIGYLVRGFAGGR